MQKGAVKSKLYFTVGEKIHFSLYPERVLRYDYQHAIRTPVFCAQVLYLHVHLLCIWVVEAALAEFAAERDHLPVLALHLLDVIVAHRLDILLFWEARNCDLLHRGGPSSSAVQHYGHISS